MEDGTTAEFPQEALADNHGQILSFGFGNASFIAASTVKHYPLLWVDYLPAQFSPNSITYSFQVIIADQDEPGESDLLNRFSDTISGFSSGLNTVYTGGSTSAAITALSSSTAYWFRVQGTAAGYTNSGYTATTGSSTTTHAYMTWAVTSSAIQFFNSNKGLQKTGGSDEWAAGDSYSTETLGAGQTVTFNCNTGPHFLLALTGSRGVANNGTITQPGNRIYIYQSVSNTLYYYALGGAATSTGVSITSNMLLRFNWSGSTMYQQHSADTGSTWVTDYAHPTAPSGQYYTEVQFYSNGAKLNEIYK